MLIVSGYIKASGHIFMEDDYTIKNKPSKMGKGVDIRCINLATKKRIEKILSDKQVQFHSFTEASDKSIQFVLKGFDYEPEPTNILEMLKEKEIPATKVGVLFKGNEKSAPVFIVQFDKSSTNLAELNHRFKKIHHTTVSWQKLQPSAKKATQCHNCQAWGHSSLNCHREARCVKCTESHATSVCPRTNKEGSAKCTNCKGEHAANYRGCSAYKSYAALFKTKAPRVSSEELAVKKVVTTPFIINKVNFPHLQRPTHASAQSRLEIARQMPDINSKPSTSHQTTKSSALTLMDYDVSSDEEDKHQTVSFSRKPMSALDVRVQESLKFLNEDPDVIKAKEAFCSLVAQLKAADHEGKIAIIAKNPFLQNAL